ncbi:LysR substrate-binding domain-containing protein [Roseomonas chloroacetimidivorans]|uniref:LysR substrate-binding domain-containing protein n=1 Tax=Roseomonas chloroacetimidivorans TaxID=1766656 RepID=UPI003C738427
MSSRRLGYFVAVAQELHVGRAAEALGMTQPALTQQLRVLETEIGVPLVRRVGRGIALTEAGSALLPEARAVLEQEAHARAVAQRAGRGEAQILNVGYVSTAMLEPALPELLFRFRAEVPGVELHLEEAVVADQLIGLQKQRLDVAIVREPAGPLPRGIGSRPFQAGRLLAAVPSGVAARLRREVRLTDLAEFSFITLRDPDGLGLAHSVWSLCRRAGFTPTISMRVADVMGAMGLIAAGFGVSLVPDSLRRVNLHGVELLELEEQEATTGLAILHGAGERSATVRRFLQTASSVRKA